MSFTGCRVGESLVAVPAPERLLSSVNTHVSLEITSVGEFLPTVLKKKKMWWKHSHNVSNVDSTQHRKT